MAKSLLLHTEVQNDKQTAQPAMVKQQTRPGHPSNEYSQRELTLERQEAEVNLKTRFIHECVCMVMFLESLSSLQ